MNIYTRFTEKKRQETATKLDDVVGLQDEKKSIMIAKELGS